MEHKGRYESLEYPDYYSVPRFPSLVISSEGRVIDIEKKVCLLPYVGFYKYPCVYSGTEILLHRLLALTFLPIPDGDIKKLQVNHIDGVKTNYALDNLEWVTVSQNAIHAYQSGLRDDNRPVLVKDLRDGSVKRYYSLQECARAFGLNGAYIHGYLDPNNREKVSRRHYVFIYEGDVWPNLTQEDIGTYRNGTKKAVVAFSKENQQKLIFESSGVAAQHFGHQPKTLVMHMLRSGIQEFHGWSFSYIDDPDLPHDLEIIRSTKTWKRAPRKPIPVRVTDSETRAVTEWESSEAFANHLGVSKNTLQAGVLRNNGHWKQYKVDLLRSNQ